MCQICLSTARHLPSHHTCELSIVITLIHQWINWTFLESTWTEWQSWHSSQVCLTTEPVPSLPVTPFMTLATGTPRWCLGNRKQHHELLLAVSGKGWWRGSTARLIRGSPWDGEHMDSGARQIQVHALALLLTGSVTMRNWQCLSEPLFSHLLKGDKISTAKKIDVRTQRINVHKICRDRKGVMFGRAYWSGTRLVGKQPTEMHAHMYEETCTRMSATAPCVTTPNNLNVHWQ